MPFLFDFFNPLNSFCNVDDTIVIALIQRVSEASVTIDQTRTAQIGTGLLALVGVRQGDTPENVAVLAKKMLHYRVFPDASGRMNLDVQQANASVLLVPQFTLAADTSSGRRPGFSTAADPILARELFDAFCQCVRTQVPEAQTGTFAANMQVALVNNGPVTFWLEA